METVDSIGGLNSIVCFKRKIKLLEQLSLSSFTIFIQELTKVRLKKVNNFFMGIKIIYVSGI